MPNYQTPYSGSDYASQIAELIGKQGVNPYAGTLIDLMRQHGAATQAAMQQQGAAKAQQWQNLGNVLDKTLTSIQQQPERARAAQMQQLELSNAQGAAEDQRADRAIGQAMRQAQLPDGTFDLAKFDQSVATISNGRRVVEARTALQGANAGASAAAVHTGCGHCSGGPVGEAWAGLAGRDRPWGNGARGGRPQHARPAVVFALWAGLQDHGARSE